MILIILFPAANAAGMFSDYFGSPTLWRRSRQSVSHRPSGSLTRRNVELDAIIKRLYEDNVIGKLPDERFSKMNAGYEREQRTLEVNTEKLKKVVDTCEEQRGSAKSFIKIVRGYIEPKELTPKILHEPA